MNVTRKLTVREIQVYQHAIKVLRQELEEAIDEHCLESISEHPDGDKGTCTGPTLRKLQAAMNGLKCDWPLPLV